MKRYKHNLGYTHLTTGDFGYLIPVGWWEALPGDSLRLSTSAFTRCTPLLAPVMHPCQIRLHTFFCPWRLVAPEFEKMITQQDSTATLPFQVPVGDDLDDYLGIPPVMAGGDTFLNNMVRLAYSLIWYEYYRDEVLQENVTYDSLAPISYEKDWSTTARFDPSNNPSGQIVTADVDGNIPATDIRQALALQKFDEARSRWGTRYTEYLRYLGVQPSDARLQRPEYLGGGVGSINFSEVLATANTTNEPTGSLLGHGVAGVRQKPMTRFIPEHGCVMTLLSVRPKMIYDQGFERFFRQDTFDEFWQKELELMGQVAIHGGEIYAEGVALADLLPWGFQDRYYQYRKKNSHVTKEFRGLYDYWHMARKFISRPGLNSVYSLVDQTATRRPFADQTPANDPLLFSISHRVRARRLVGPANRAPRTV